MGREYSLAPFLLSLFFLCSCSRSQDTEAIANDEKAAKQAEAVQKVEKVAEKVEQKAKRIEKAEGKQDLVKDEVYVKTTPEGEPVIEQKGEASRYGKGFHGKTAANGKRFDQNKLTAAHPTLPLGSKAKVTNLDNGKSVDVEITDRGPYARGRDIDLSQGAAKELGITKKGVAPVNIEAQLPPEEDATKSDSSKVTEERTPPKD